MAPAGLPFALVEQGAKGLRLAAVNAAARNFGLSRGQRLADARAAVPDLLTEAYDRSADQASLLGLCRWMERYSPWVSPEGVDGILLEATGVAHLFGGEAAMGNDINRRLVKYGFTVKLAFADTIGAAWALARYGEGTSPTALTRGPPSPRRGDKTDADRPLSLERGDRREATVGEVSSLPVEALRIDGEAARTLRRLGLKTIGSLTAIPRAALARRFRGEHIHDNVLLRLDELLGTRDEPLNPINPPSSFMAHRTLMEPVISHEGLVAILRGLTQSLARDLEREGQGALRLILKLFRSDGGRMQMPAGLSAPSHDGAHLFRLLTPKLETLDAGFGIDAMTLEAREVASVAGQQYGFMEETHEKSLAELNDRVLNRHEHGLVALEAVESHVPERAERDRDLTLPSPLDAATGPSLSKLRLARGEKNTRGEKRKPVPSPSAAWRGGDPASRQRCWEGEVPSRPHLILDRPELATVLAAVPDGAPLRMTWRRVARRIVKAEGPERIAPEWWLMEGTDRVRDYYRIEDDKGRRYWLYRDGLYGEDVQPKWFVHGLSG